MSTKHLETQNMKEINEIHEKLLKNPIFKRWIKEDEPEYKRKLLIIRKIFWFFLILSLVIYSSVFIIFPHQPNSDLFLKLNNFMNEYLLGYLLPELSDKFSFKMKSVWCFSLIINPIIFIFIFVSDSIILNKSDILLILSWDEDLEDKKSIFYKSIKYIILDLFFYFGSIYMGIYSYAYGNATIQNPHKYKTIESNFFYQNLYPSFGMFLVSILLIFVCAIGISLILNLLFKKE